MSETLGYRANGMPILPIPNGVIATKAVVMCRECRGTVRPYGGPIDNVYCVPCWEARKTRSEA